MKPAWWQLYGLVVLLVTLIGVIDASIPTGILRTILESIAVVFAFGLMLVWRHHNRTALELERRR
jgi:energy-coupling factor transporter transmembrane protein EcfT